MSLISVDFYEFKNDSLANLVWHTTKPLFVKSPYQISHCNLVLDNYTVVTSNKFSARLCDRDTFNRMYEPPVYSHTFGETNLTNKILDKLHVGDRGSISTAA